MEHENDYETLAINGTITQIKYEDDALRVIIESKEPEEDSIPLKDYEAEINDLKDEIERLREMYQLEHLKVLKLKSEASESIAGDSHNPQKNIYSDDWRRP